MISKPFIPALLLLSAFAMARPTPSELSPFELQGKGASLEDLEILDGNWNSLDETESLQRLTISLSQIRVNRFFHSLDPVQAEVQAHWNFFISDVSEVLPPLQGHTSVRIDFWDETSKAWDSLMFELLGQDKARINGTLFEKTVPK